MIITGRELYSQSYLGRLAIGAGGIYNFKTKGIAPDVRLLIPFSNRVYLTPHFSYFAKFNKVNEYYAGADLDIHMPVSNLLIPYIFAGAYYNKWINSSEFHNKLAEKENVVAEAGLGLLFNSGCLNPFLEYRYNTKWEEGSLEFGIILRFGSCFRISKSRQRDLCPAY